MSNLSYFILTDQEKTIINQTHVDWFGYGFDAFIEYAPVSFIIIFPFILVIGILMRRIELDRTKENPEIRQPEPNAFKMISQILICSLILSILGTVLTAGTIAYQKVTLAQSYAAQSYAGLRYPVEDEDTNEKLIKHGFNPQDFVQITERTETYDIVPGTLKKKAKNGEYKNVESVGEDKGSSDDWGDYKADIIVGYVGNEPKTKEYKWQNLNYFNKLKVKNYVVTFISIIALYIVLSFTFDPNDAFSYTKGIYINILIFVLFAVSLNITVGLMGQLNLGQAGFIAIGGYSAAFISKILVNYNLPTFLQLILVSLFGGLVAAVFGFLVGGSTLRLRGDYLAIITLAFGEIVKYIIQKTV